MVSWPPKYPPEPSRHDVPLCLLRDAAPASSLGAAAETLLRDESRRCFAFRWRNVLKSEECTHAYGSLVEHAPWVEIKGAKGSTRRSTAWYTKGACSCSYTYSTVRIPGKHVRQMSAAFQQAMERLTALVFTRLFPQLPQEKWPNSANLDLYANGRQGVGWHADDEKMFGGKYSDCPIVSLSLGGRRELWMALRHEDDGALSPLNSSIVETDLSAGDVMSMEGLFQKHCVHFVPLESNRRASVCTACINITWRWIVNHKWTCPLVRGGDNVASWQSCGSFLIPPVDIGRHVEISQWWGNGEHGPPEWGRCVDCDHNAWAKGRLCLDRRCRRCCMRDCSNDHQEETELRLESLLASLTTRVKSLMRGWRKQTWIEYCAAFGNSTLDPGLHDATFLRLYLEQVRSFPADVQNEFDEVVGKLSEKACREALSKGRVKSIEVRVRSSSRESSRRLSKSEAPGPCHPEETWDDYFDPHTGRRWLGGVYDWFWAEPPAAAADAGWTCFADSESLGGLGIWWWHADTGRYFADPKTRPGYVA